MQGILRQRLSVSGFCIQVLDHRRIKTADPLSSATPRPPRSAAAWSHPPADSRQPGLPRAAGCAPAKPDANQAAGRRFDSFPISFNRPRSGPRKDRGSGCISRCPLRRWMPTEPPELHAWWPRHAAGRPGAPSIHCHAARPGSGDRGKAPGPRGSRPRPSIRAGAPSAAVPVCARDRSAGSRQGCAAAAGAGARAWAPLAEPRIPMMMRGSVTRFASEPRRSPRPGPSGRRQTQTHRPGLAFQIGPAQRDSAGSHGAGRSDRSESISCCSSGRAQPCRCPRLPGDAVVHVSTSKKRDCLAAIIGGGHPCGAPPLGTGGCNISGCPGADWVKGFQGEIGGHWGQVEIQGIAGRHTVA